MNLNLKGFVSAEKKENPRGVAIDLVVIGPSVFDKGQESSVLSKALL
jgi:hypothetical protein